MTNRARELSWARACALVRDRARLIERPGTDGPEPLGCRSSFECGVQEMTFTHRYGQGVITTHKL